MHRIADMKQRREDRFWENRMKLADVQKQTTRDREVINNRTLVKETAENVAILEKVQEREKQRQEEKQA